MSMQIVLVVFIQVLAYLCVDLDSQGFYEEVPLGLVEYIYSI